MLRAQQGDITKVTGFTAIVNPANNSLLGGGGIDGLIHRAAGPQLKTECRRLNGCETGDSRLTLGYNLPCKYVIHTVGPVWNGGLAGEEELLISCYETTLKIALDEGIRKIAFSSISTGEYGYPLQEAANVAVKVVSSFVEKHPDSFDEICWVVPDEDTAKAYAEEIKTAVPKKPSPKKRVKKSADDTSEQKENVQVEESEKAGDTNLAEEMAVTEDTSANKEKSENKETAQNIEPADSEDNKGVNKSVVSAKELLCRDLDSLMDKLDKKSPEDINMLETALLNLDKLVREFL